MTGELLDLPPELLTHILSSLALYDLLSATSACATLRALLQSFMPLQYRLALLSSGYVDNPSDACPLVLSERLAALRAREAAWSAANMKRTTRIPTPQGGPSGVYDLTGGLYFLGQRGDGITGATTRAMRWVRLPGAGDKDVPDKPVWTTIDVGEDIIDIGLSVHELDLIAIVTSKPAPLDAEPSRTISIHLIQLSTGHPHPAAHTPVLPMLTVPLRAGRCTIALEAAGQSLLFLATFPSPDGPGAHSDDRLWAVNWCAGTKHAFRAARSGTYAGVVLLAHDACMLPNIVDGTLELFRLPPSLCAPPSAEARDPKDEADGERPTPALAPPQDDDFELPVLVASRALALPDLASGCRIIQANCRSEPGPVARGTPVVGSDASRAKDERPFAEDPEEAIVLVTLILVDPVPENWGEDLASFEFVVHRSVLLGMLPPLEDIQGVTSHIEDVEVGVDSVMKNDYSEEDEQPREESDDGADDREPPDLEDITFFPGSFGAPSSPSVMPVPYPRTSSSGRASPTSSSGDSHPFQRAMSSPGSSHARSHSPASVASASSRRTPSSASSMPSLGTASSSSDFSQPDVVAPLAWGAWGPPVTRWLKLDEAQSNWITTTSGQRHAVLEEGDLGTRRRLRVLDFGRVRAKKGLAHLRHARAGNFEANILATETPVAPNISSEESAALNTVDAPGYVFEKDAVPPADEHGWDAEEMEVLDEHVVGAWHDAGDWVSDDEFGGDGAMYPSELDDADGVLVGTDDRPLPSGDALLGASAPDVRFVPGTSVLRMSNFFADDVCSCLPYFEARSVERYTYNSVLMDEERVLGLIMSQEDEVIALDVIQFG